MAKIPPGVGPRFPQVVVLFGATGDLARRKLLPGLFHLSSVGFIPGCRVIGVSLDDIDADGFRLAARAALDAFSARKITDADWRAFSDSLDYVPLAAGPAALKAAVERAEQSLKRETRRLHYLSVPPNAALPAVRMLHEAGLVDNARIIMEKPFGTDLASAVSLNAQLHEVFDEDSIFRIDHFLGKEPAQNILAFRFANGLFEPIWNRNFIDHVQIDVPETLGLGQRSGFYEQTGAFRDMVVTHLFQILAFMAMEPPTSLEPAPISEEKNKVFRSMLPIRAERRGPRPVHRLPGRGRCQPRIGDRDLHRAALLDRQLALGRRAVLPAHRQAHGRGPAHHLDRLPRAAQEHVPGRFRRRRPGPRPPDLRPRRRVEDVAVVLRQAPRARHAAGQAEPAVRDARHRPHRRRARGL